MHQFLKVRLFGPPLSSSLIQRSLVESVSGEYTSGKVKIKVIGKHADNPEAVLDFLKKRMVDAEKQRDELKPQWLREWEDSRRPGQSVPP
jgi:hypothetical protein